MFFTQNFGSPAPSPTADLLRIALPAILGGILTLLGVLLSNRLGERATVLKEKRALEAQELDRVREALRLELAAIYEARILWDRSYRKVLQYEAQKSAGSPEALDSRVKLEAELDRFRTALSTCIVQSLRASSATDPGSAYKATDDALAWFSDWMVRGGVPDKAHGDELWQTLSANLKAQLSPDSVSK